MIFTPPPPKADTDPAGGFLSARFTLDQPPYAGHAYHVTFRICPNPCCRCGVIGFECQAEGSPDRPPYRFDLDPFQRSLTSPPSPADEDAALGRAFHAEAGEEVWNWLGRAFFATKRRQMATLNLDTLAVDLPDAVKADPSSLVDYRDLFPWAEELAFEHGGARWFVHDQYCASPGCGCTQVGLACFQVPAEGSPSTGPIECVTFLFHDTASGQTSVREAQPGSPGPEALMESLRTAHPDFARTLRQRHGQLQRLGRRFLSRSAAKRRSPAPPLGAAADPWFSPPPPPARVPPRPGRNDPCPCGSGKKFKKCCGAARPPAP